MTKAFAGVAAAALLMVCGPATAGQPSVDINGAWAGEGYVQKNDESDPMNVRCEIEGAQHDDRLGFDGECRAMMILRRDIGADLVFDGERFRGTYEGARVGVADLEGASSPDGRVVLTMRFPREVNGDDTATMTIHLHDDDTFTIETVDRMKSGNEVTTSLIRFERR
jgi:hypothetical protein